MKRSWGKGADKNRRNTSSTKEEGVGQVRVKGKKESKASGIYKERKENRPQIDAYSLSAQWKREHIYARQLKSRGT